MILKKTSLALLFILIFNSKVHSEEVVGKVLDSYTKGDITHCTLEVKKPLVCGKNITLSNGVNVSINEKLGEKDDIYYYDASSANKPKIPIGTDVFGGEVKTFIKDSEMFMNLERKTTFAPKQRGEVTAVQNDRVLVDRGSLHEVKERDLYAVYDSSGKYKGKVELRGVGDFQSSGKVYRSAEDVRKKVTVEPGDKIKYLGQRKLFGLGIVGQYGEPLRKEANSFGGGLIWNLTFPDGWGAELLLGGYFEQVKSDSGIKLQIISGRSYTSVYTNEGGYLGSAMNGEAYTFTTMAPFIIKKNFFYPKVVSPFLGVGFSFFRGEYESKKTIIDSYDTYFGDLIVRGNLLHETVKKQSFFPIFAAGVNLFSGKFFQVKMDAKYYMTPDLETSFSTLETKRWIYSLGFITAW